MNHPFNHLGRLLTLAALPVALLTACGDDDDSPTPTPAPDQGKVMVVHAAPLATAAIKVTGNDNKDVGGQINYGQNTGYADVLTGNQALKLNNAAGTTLASQALTVEKDKNYSVYAYSPAGTIGSIASLGVVDDLTAPSSGRAKIRLVHLGFGAPSPVNLSVEGAVAGSGQQTIVPNVAFGTASSFVEISPANYKLAISTGTGSSAVVKLNVGDGNGDNSTTASKTYVAGKIYTVLLRGVDNSAADASLQLKAFIIENN